MKQSKPYLLSALKTSLLNSPRIKPTITFSILETLLPKCRHARQLGQVHAQMTVSGLIHDAFAASRLLFFSASSPSLHLQHSSLLLRQLDNPNTFSWNTLIRAHAHRSSPELCLPIYKAMLQRGSIVDNYTHPVLIHSCALRGARNEGVQIHAHVLMMGFDSDVYVINTLISLYTACGSLEDARRVFNMSPVRDSVSWNSMLAAYVENGDVQEAVRIFDKMPEKNVIATNSMIGLFGKTDCVCKARELFDGMGDRDVITWTTMISCYEQNGRYAEAMEMFFRMSREGVSVDEVVLVSILSACVQLGTSTEGEVIHGLIIRTGLEAYVNLQNALIHMYSSCGNINAAGQLFDLGDYLDQISWNSMISGYLKCGLVTEAKDIFDAMPKKDMVSWSTMISGYAQHDHFSETLALFHEMQVGAIHPDETTLVSWTSS